MTGMWVTVQDKDAAEICKGLQICEAHKRKRYVDTDRNSICRELSRNEQKQDKPKR